MKISIVIPIYRCKNSLIALYRRLRKTLESITSDYEIIFVNDHCPQDSWSLISMLADDDPRTKGISLSKNFGQHYAITAGLDYAQGDWIVVMDGDLQDVPEEIPKLYNKAQEGFDIVLARRINRSDSFFKKKTSKLFYTVLSYFTGVQYDSAVANFGIYSKQCIESIKLYRERNRAFHLFVELAGFKKTAITVFHSNRDEGTSSYNFLKRLRLAGNIILAHSNKPLRFSIVIGFIISLLSLSYAGYLCVNHFIFHSPVLGWTSLMVSMFFMFGLTFSFFGILGLYIGKIFDEVKQRPLYLVNDMLNIHFPPPSSNARLKNEFLAETYTENSPPLT